MALIVIKKDPSAIKMSPSLPTIAKRFTLVVIPLLLLLFSISFWYYQAEKKMRLVHLKSHELHALQKQQELVAQKMKEITTDLLFLARNSESLLSRVGNGAISDQALAQQFLDFCSTKEKYDQIRLLDASGMELIRVNFNNGKPLIVPADQLQSKGKRYYFTDTVKLAAGEIFVSPLDLNIEHGAVEIPVKPVIRVGTPIKNANGTTIGIVLLNYLGADLLQALGKISDKIHGQFMMLNADGFWLKGSNLEQEWGFMFKERSNLTFSASFPTAWPTISGEESGQFQTKEGLFSFSTIHPLWEGLKSSTGSPEAFARSEQKLDAKQYYWKLVSHISPPVLASKLSSLKVTILILSGISSLLIIGSAWLLAAFYTKREQAEKAFNDQRRHLETIVNSTPAIICLKDGEGRWLLANDYDLELFQLNGVDYKGKTDADLAPYSDFYRDAFLGCMDSDNKAWEAQTPSHGEEIIPRPDGASLTFAVTKIPLFNPDGSRHALVVVGHDITERKRHEAAMARSKEEWEKTFDAIPDIITIQDQDMRIVRANKGAYDFFEMKYGNFIGKTCHDIFRGVSDPCPGCPGLASLQDIQAHSEIIEHKGLQKIFHVSSSPILDENNEVQFLVHIAKDFTEQKRLEEELFQAHKMEAIGTLAGGIAHDFNNILTAIIGFSELVKMDVPADSPAGKDIDQVIKAGQRAADLVQQILSFSRKTDHHLQQIEPHLIVKEVLKMLRASLPSTITIQKEIDSECGKIQADPAKLHHIIVNLCTNALHAMEDEKGTLTVSLCRRKINQDQIAQNNVSAGQFVVLSVTDTGHGMDKETVQRIFEPYFSTKDVGKGSGLGLAVIHGIILDYKGFIEVESTPGQGSTFRIYLPSLEEVISPPELSSKAVSLPTGTEHILLVDDESLIIDFNKTVLEELGYTVTATTESEDALEKIRARPDQFDLIITDQTMPDLTGAELAQEALKTRANMPIIMCTGYSSVFSKEDALAAGIRRYETKPVGTKKLARIVRDLLDEN